MDIKKAYKVMQAACGIEIGDRVKVLRTVKSKGEMGWDAGRDEAMDKMVGNAYTVKELNDKYGIYLGSWWLPFFALELVEKAKKPEKMVDVDGKKISLSTVKSALRLLSE